MIHEHRPIQPLSKRTALFEESVIREMTRLGDEAGAINLSQGLPDFDTPREILAAAEQAIQAGENQYTFPFGDLAFRQSIARKSASYNRLLADPESEITVTCGVSEAIMATFFALTEPGDEIVLFEPWYENYIPACRLTGTIPRFVRLQPPNYSFEPRDLRKVFNNHTRLIVVNTPHNPTGKVYSSEELAIIAELCQEYGVIAITDEIYEYIVYEGQQHLSLGSLPGMQDRTVTISGLGKTFAVTGWRVGWTVAHQPITNLIRKVHDYLTICAPAPFQKAGTTAFNMPDSFFQSLRAQYQDRRNILLSSLDGLGFSYFKPQGAYYVMADFQYIHWDSRPYTQHAWPADRAFSEYMAREVGVAVVPASSFYTNSKKDSTYIRINFARKESTLYAAGDRLKLLKQD
jgi:aminotransferase